MVSNTQAVVLGALQGFTEFLPVSSSGHLVLAQTLWGLEDPELLFDVIVHLGTLLAVAIFFWRDLWGMLRGLWARDDEARLGRRMLALVVAGSLPTGLMGVFLKDFFEGLFASPAAVGGALCLTGCLLFLTRFAPARGRLLERTGLGRAFLVGVAQGCAITPGLSRSGTTIAVGMLLGLERELAARFSFLLSLPAVAGAVLLHLMELRHGGGAPLETTPLLLGGLVAGVSGLLALRLLLGLVRHGRIIYFAPYCILVGLVTLVASFWS